MNNAKVIKQKLYNQFLIGTNSNIENTFLTGLLNGYREMLPMIANLNQEDAEYLHKIIDTIYRANLGMTVPEIPDHEPFLWTKNDLQFYEAFNGFYVRNLKTGETRGMGDGVDMITDYKDRTLSPGTILFNLMFAHTIEYSYHDYYSAYFG